MAFDLGDYKDVATRIAEFKERFPDGSLRPLNPERPYTIEAIGGQVFVVYVAAAYREPNDPAPGVGTAWEPVPGLTPYTKNSEIQNAETSAWGRAIVASLASESKHIASAEDVRNRQDEPLSAPVISKTLQMQMREILSKLDEEDLDELKAHWKETWPPLDRLQVEQYDQIIDYVEMTYGS